jgi:hypothetical protein
MHKMNVSIPLGGELLSLLAAVLRILIRIQNLLIPIRIQSLPIWIRIRDRDRPF